MATVSIAMGTFNGTRFLLEQLESLSRQTHLPAELVITDDGSTDATGDIVHEFGLSAPFPVHFHRNARNLGYKANFVHCASLCKSDLIAFCDQDDIWHPDKLAKMTAFLDDPKLLMVYHTFRLFDQNQNEVGPVVDQTSEIGSPWAKVYGITQVFRRSLIRFNDMWADSVDHFAPDQPMSHDEWFYFLAHAFDAVRYVPLDLIDYRQHTNNICGFQEVEQDGQMQKIAGNFRIVAGRSREFEDKKEKLAGYWTGLAAGSRYRAQVLPKLQERPPARLTMPPERIAYYRGLNDYYAKRAELFTSRSRSRRLALLLDLFARGGCGSRGLRDRAVDLIYGLLG